MGKIKKILEKELGSTQRVEVYPVTSIEAVYDENNERLDSIINRKNKEIQKELKVEVERASNAESNLRETINNLTEINENATSANIVTIDTIPNTSSSNVQQALNELFKNATFAGVATPTTNPGIPNGPIFYLATTTGSYSNFGNIEVLKGETAILKWNNGIWAKSSFKSMTDFNSVFDANGKTLSDKLTELDSDISELDGKLYSTQEIDGYDVATITNNAIKIDGSLYPTGSYKLLSIPNDNYISIYGKASSYVEYYYIVAFWNSLTPSTESLISGIVCQTSYVNQNFNIQIPSGTKLIGVTYHTTAGAAEVTLVKKSNKFEEIEKEIDEIKGNLPSQIQSEVSTAVAPFTKTKDKVDAMLKQIEAQVYSPNDFIEDGYYNDKNISRTSGYNYVSLPLIHVVEGQTIYWHKWSKNSDIAETMALCCYDNDGLPYNGVSARRNYSNLTTQDYINGEFSFVIPSNCSQIGVSFKFKTNSVQDGATFVVGDNSYELTQLAKDLINQVVEIDTDGGDRTAHFFLKGNSNIVYSSSKKLGIIAAGQSNIDGRNSYSDLPSSFVNPNSKVKICKNSSGTFTDFMVTNGGKGNDWSFDAILYDTLTNPSYGNLSEIFVIKKSMGGTSIDPNGATEYHWTAEYEGLPAGNSLLRDLESYIRAGINTQGSNFDIKAFIWHQGEGDADNSDVASRYYENLKNMIAYVRGVVGNPRLHFFCGNLSNNNVANHYKSVINEAYAKIASEDHYFHCIDMRDAVLKDGYHFNYQWSIYFGQKVYDEMIDTGIISGTKINPQKPI